MRELSRREFLKLGARLSGGLIGVTFLQGLLPLNFPAQANPRGEWVNDVHAQLNRTRMRAVLQPDSEAALRHILQEARRCGRPVIAAGGRHSMGGQQFVEDGVLVDTARLSRILHLDADAGVADIQAGIQWPALMSGLAALQGDNNIWGIRQKPTGTDSISLGGCVSSNVHSRGLVFPPFISDVESFTLMNAEGELLRCSRAENPELFRLTHGGYGLFGIVTELRLRLVRRQKVRRLVRMIGIDELMPAFNRAIADGVLYGDYQFALDPGGEDFLTEGILSVYQPIPDDSPIAEEQKSLTLADWSELVSLAHTDKVRAFAKYRDHYLETDGQCYWSDTHQSGPYRNGYHLRLNPEGRTASEMITELYVPRAALPGFMRQVAAALRERGADLIYGTIRLIEKDTESFLPWAKDDYACVIFNLHFDHTPHEVRRVAETFRMLVDRALACEGNYYLTYHRFATKAQVEKAYPRFAEFLDLKRHYDPDALFQSTWYRHYARLFT